MKILSIVWYKILPPVYGGQKGIALFNNYLSQQVPLTCLCSADNIAEQTPYSVLPHLPIGRKQFIQPSTWKLIRQTAQHEQATHLLLEHPYHGIAAVKACASVNAKLIVHSHNIESERFRRLGHKGWQVLAKYEKWVHSRAALNLFKTEADRQYAIRHFGLKEKLCMIVPYGIEKRPDGNREKARLQVRTRYGLHPDEQVLLFAGTLDYAPNANAVKAIYEHVAPRLHSMGFHGKIIISGRNKHPGFQYLDQLQHPLVVRLPEVQDIHTYFDGADLFINPVLTGGGVQTKNIDALAHHTPVLAFDSMVDPLLKDIAGDKITTIPAGNWDVFVNHIPEAARKIAHTSAAFFAYFDWQRITGDLVKRIAEI